MSELKLFTWDVESPTSITDFNYDVVESFRSGDIVDPDYPQSYYQEFFRNKTEMFDLYNSIYNEKFHTLPAARTFYPAWVPAYDNYDGSEKFWCLFEKTRIPKMMQESLGWGLDELCRDEMVSSLYIWLVVVYYSLLIVGGNELQPAQLVDMFYIVSLNVFGLFFLTYLTGQISVLIANVIQKSGGYQEEIDTINTAMKNEHLSDEL